MTARERGARVIVLDAAPRALRGGNSRHTRNVRYFHPGPDAPEIQYISYFASIKRKIELVWQYPYEAAAAGIQGELSLDFVIARSGAVDSITLVRSSGSKILDDEAIRSIRKAAPFDPIPADYKIASLQIRGRFVYVHGGALRLR